jgi:hypothetical protein
MDHTLHPGMTKTLLIVYHSMTGGTRQMVEAAARGAALEPPSACFGRRQLKPPISSKRTAASSARPRTWPPWPA